jgi:hypothetical protein
MRDLVSDSEEVTVLSEMELISHSVGDGSFGWRQQRPLHIRRARSAFASLSVIAAAFAVAWVFGVSEGHGFSLSLPAVVFVMGFVVPVCAYSALLACISAPVISLYDDRIELASTIFPWRKAVLDRKSIVSVGLDATHGDGPDTGPQYAHGNLMFKVSPECFATQHRNRIWHHVVDSVLVFPIDNLELSQGQCFGMVEAYVLSHRL